MDPSPSPRCRSDALRSKVDTLSPPSPACICGVSLCITAIQIGQPMPRKRSHLKVAISLLLCIITAALWVRSYWRRYEIAYDGPGGLREVMWAQGHVLFVEDNYGSFHRHAWIRSWPIKEPTFRFSGWWGRHGFVFGYYTQPRGAFPSHRKDVIPDSIPEPAILKSWAQAVPLWFLLLLFSIPLAIAARSPIRRWRRRRSGRCEVCGYDLRASGERCPECGTPVSCKTVAGG